MEKLCAESNRSASIPMKSEIVKRLDERKMDLPVKESLTEGLNENY